VIAINAVPLDSIENASVQNADFIKIDTQGSEFEILTGASGLLSKSCFAVTCETWLREVHKGQKLTADIMIYMAEQGFFVIGMEHSANWARAKMRQNLDKPDLIGVDLLFFKNIDRAVAEFDQKKLIRAAMVADLWGHSSIALHLLRAASARPGSTASTANQLEEVIIKCHRAYQPLISGRPARIFNRVAQEFLGAKPIYPKIHE
jgi:hypothetical protein